MPLLRMKKINRSQSQNKFKEQNSTHSTTFIKISPNKDG